MAVNVNEYYSNIQNNYLFVEIARRVEKYQEENPDANLIKMGIGDVTRPLTKTVIKAFHEAVDEMADADTFRGYGPEQGYAFLIEDIIENDFNPLGVELKNSEVFVSDGAKCDTGNFQELFSQDNIIAVTDPVYPVYVDSNVMAGRSGKIGDDGFYEKIVKRAMDIVLSFFGLVLLSPVFLFLSLWIVIDDPGPILFTQKRIGRDKQYFKLHKFRSMKMSTPHNVPTHMLENPEQYITKSGKFIRSHSLDELPQIWDIFIGNMSVVGPRPGLWNQDLLTAERDRWGANDVKPGLTGWAQINGRDELEIPVKAKLDGEYVQNFGLKMDIKCFLGSVGVFKGDSSVVEGGTGEMHKKEQKQ